MKYWFHQKKYGYGFVPVTWHGWLATLVFVGLIMLSAFSSGFFGSKDPTVREAAHYFFDIIVLSALFILLMRDKCKGGIRWRWGQDHTKSDEDQI